jgi:hypothetical protein
MPAVTPKMRNTRQPAATSRREGAVVHLEFSVVGEPTGRANARPMTGSAKQSRNLSAEAVWIASSQVLLAMTAELFEN